MNRLLVLALGAPMVLIGAAYPDKIENDGAHPAPPPMAQDVSATYRPCRPGPGDDRCIQLYERGVRAAYARWQREHGDEPATRVAMGGPVEEAAPRPRRRHHVASRPDRCAHPRHHERQRRHAPPPDLGHEPEALGM